MANLYVTITEEITLPNNNIEKTYNFKSIEGVNEIVRRVNTIATTFSGSGIEILRFCNTREEQTGGGFVKEDVKYVRITNLSKTYPVVIYLLDVDNESTLLNLSPGKSLMFNDADFNASSTKDYMDESFVDEMYYSSFVYIDSIKAKAMGGNAQIEYFVASS
jgi:hypothetical protein